MIRAIRSISAALRRNTATWGPVLAWMAVIFILSSIPSLGDTTRNRWRLDPNTAAHVMVFAALGFLVVRAMIAGDVSRAAWWTVVVGLSYAITDEIHQSFVPGRTPSVWDIAADGVGVMLGILAFRRLAGTIGTSLDRAVRATAPRRR